MHKVISLSLVALLALGCASDPYASESGTPSGYGGMVEEALPPPPPLKGKLTVPTPSVIPTPVREFNKDEQAWLDAAWNIFKKQDPRWPEVRQEWVAMGIEAQSVLADNLYRAMVAARAASALHLVDTARKDLVLLGEPAVPTVVYGLATRAFRGENGEEVRVGQSILHDAAETLSLIGAPAVPGLLDIARSGEKVLVTEAVWALGNIGDARARSTILELAQSSDWQTRSGATLALRGYDDTEVGAMLVRRLEDEESLVVQRAAQAMVARRNKDVLPACVGVLERSLESGRAISARGAEFTLKKLTGKSHGHDTAAWRRLLGER
jgi:hypothetical protein